MSTTTVRLAREIVSRLKYSPAAMLMADSRTLLSVIQAKEFVRQLLDDLLDGESSNIEEHAIDLFKGNPTCSEHRGACLRRYTRAQGRGWLSNPEVDGRRGTNSRGCQSRGCLRR